MARKPVVDMSAWPSLSLEGNLIAPAMVASVDRREAPEQTEADYRIRKGLTIREEISTAFRVGQSHFDTFAKIAHPSADATRRFIKAFLQETFGFDDLVPADGALAFIAGGRVPIVVVPPSDEKLDRRSATLSTDRTRSPAFALQDHLNEHDEALLGLVTNGTLIRLMRDNASLTRPAYIEADLAQIFTNEDAASFAVLWLLIHRTRFGVADAPATDCALERWRDAGSKEGEVARDRLAVQVQIALKVLGSGFLEANPDLAAKLKSGEINLTEWFNELLRLVYRLIFLMVAEDRNLLHPEKAKPDARKLYAEGYSLSALRAQCTRAASWDKHHDRYEGIKIVFHALAHGQEALALPALGGLFAGDKLPRLETARLRNRAFMEALYRLSWLDQKTGMVPVNWRAMETEELGSVYESLLELQPQLGDDGKTLVFASEAAEQRGNQRKTTGSYYTPDSLVQALLDTALDPVLDKTEAEADDPARALLKLSVIDPACGSGHFLLAAARRIATRLARIRADGTPSLADFRHALRDVARSCLHGVDRNPMAVELTKVALWIETVDPGLPLGFFDAQIRCGDALLGVFDLKVLRDGIPDAAYKPLTGDDKDTARYYARANRDAREGQSGMDFGTGRAGLPAAPVRNDYTGFRDLPEDTLDQIDAKSRRFRSIREGQAFHMAEMACNLYVAAFLLPKTGGPPMSRGARLIPTSEDVWEAARDRPPFGPLVQKAEAARDARAFHWPLEFPDVMQRGGFDVVLGNPPWERIKLQEQEFFAALSPEIANAPNKAARDRLIGALRVADPGTPERTLHMAFETAKRVAEASSEFARVPGDEGGRFALSGRGDVNTYALFAELFANLARQRAGVIVPTGIATDATTAPFFAHLVEQRRLARLVDFENRAGLFPAVDSRMKFTLLTLGRDEPVARFAFFLTAPGQLAEAERNFTLTPADIAAINPNTRTAPVFRSRADAALTAKIYARVPVLIDEGKGRQGNPWGVSFMAMFHMSNDSALFRTAAQLAAAGFVRDGVDWVRAPAAAGGLLALTGGRGGGELALPGGGPNVRRFVPLYEAKMIHQFDHRWAGYDGDGTDTADITTADKADPAHEPRPRYWVPDAEVAARLAARGWTRRWLMGWRDITNATNERTVIATAFPRAGVGNNLPLMFFGETVSPRQLAGLTVNLCAIAFDFAARHKVGGTHLNYFIYQQLPLLPPRLLHRTPPRLHHPEGPGTHLYLARPRPLRGRPRPHRPALRLGRGPPRAPPRRSRRLLCPRLRPDPRRAALHPRPRRREGRGLPLGNLPRPEGKGNPPARRIPHSTPRPRSLGSDGSRWGIHGDGDVMIEVPQGFVVAQECHKVAWQNGYRRALGEADGWARYGSTTAKGTVWFAAAGHDGPWFLALDHLGIVEELNLPKAGMPGPGLVRCAFPNLTALYAVMPRVYQLGVTLPDGPLEEFRAAVANLPKSTEAEKLVIQRVGQDIFRDRLMTYWQGRCPLTGIADAALLRASHIIAWKDCPSDADRLDVHNGLLLSALWDAAFDRGLVSFDDDGLPQFSPKLSETARAELRWHSPIPLTDKHRARLVWHRANPFTLNQ